MSEQPYSGSAERTEAAGTVAETTKDSVKCPYRDVGTYIARLGLCEKSSCPNQMPGHSLVYEGNGDSLRVCEVGGLVGAAFAEQIARELSGKAATA